MVFLTLTLLGLFLRRLYQRYWNPNGVVIFWDVGQGDSALLQLPFGKSYLIDTGGGRMNPQAGNELSFELGQKGILQLDALVMSHPDEDHISGAFQLLRYLEAKEFWYHGNLETLTKKPFNFARIKSEAKSRGYKLQAFARDQAFKGRGYSLKLFPITPLRSQKINNLALTAELNLYGCRFLFTGDAELESEKILSKKINSGVHVLKVAHHGSMTSSSTDFIDSVVPHYAVISVGSKNRYGHPRKEVIQRFTQRKMEVLRTDLHGYIQFTVTPEGKMLCQNSLGDCGTFDCLNPKNRIKAPVVSF